MTPRECPNCGRIHPGADFDADPGPVQRERDRLAEALRKGVVFERRYQESLGATWTVAQQEWLDSVQTAFIDAYSEALAGLPDNTDESKNAPRS